MQTITRLRTYAADTLTDRDYRDMFDELRGNKSLDKMIKFMEICQVDNPAHVSTNKAIWWRYEKGETGLTWAMRNDLRCASGLEPLPPQVVDLVSRYVSGDASVDLLGEGEVHQLILVADGAELLPQVAPVVAPRPRRQRQPRGTIEVPADLFARVNVARQAKNKSWSDLLAVMIERWDQLFP